MKPKNNPKNSSKSQPSLAAVPLDQRTWLAALVLLVVTAALYWPCVHNDFVDFDDLQYAGKNQHVLDGLTWSGVVWAFTTQVVSNWHPLTMISLMMDCQFFGPGPWGHHFINLLLHAVNTSLVFLVFRQMTGAFWRSWVVAALFGWHPLHVESVAWLAERKDVLSTLFWLLALWMYFRYVAARGANQVKAVKLFYGLALLFTALGLMSKAMLVTMPCLMLVLDFWPLGRFKTVPVRTLVMEKVPFVILVAVFSFVAFEVQNQTGAVGSTTYYPLSIRVGNALISYCRYVEKIFWPNNLAIFYPYPVTGVWPAEWVALAVLGIGVASFLFFMDRAKRPYLLAGWLWYLGTLVPVIGLVQIGGQAMADRYTYVPAIGIFVLVCWSIYDLVKGFRPAKIGLALVTGAVALACLVLTRQQVSYWQGTETLFRHALAVTQDNSMAHYVLASKLSDEGKLDEAIQEFRESLRINPNDSNEYVNLGVALLRNGQTGAAIEQFQEGIRRQPNNSNAHFNLGEAYFKLGMAGQAAAEFQKTLDLDPNDPDAPGMLAKAKAMMTK